MNKSQLKDSYFKVVFLGNSGVGKSSLIKYYEKKGQVPSNITSTIGVDIVVVSDQLRDSSEIRYFIYDTPGQDRWKSVSYSNYKNAAGIILVYSVTDRQSFEDVNRWVQDISDHCGDNEWILVANKTDVEKAQRVVTFEDGEALAKVYGVRFFETSIYDTKRPNHAVTIKQVMATLGEAMNERRKKRKEALPAEGGMQLGQAQLQPSTDARRCRC